MAVSSTVKTSVVTVPSKKASLYWALEVPRSTSLLVVGLMTPSTTLNCDVPLILTITPAASAASSTNSPSTSMVKSAAAASSSVVVNVVAPC